MTSTLAIVLPGAGYTPLGPAIRFPVLALEQTGATIRHVEYPELPEQYDDEAWSALGAVVACQVERFVASGTWYRVYFVAKSLGTAVLARIAGPVNAPDPHAIWLTPLFRDPVTRRGAIFASWPSLLVAGTADHYHDADGFAEVREALGADSLLIDRAHHGLEIGGDVTATLKAMTDLVQATLDFAAT